MPDVPAAKRPPWGLVALLLGLLSLSLAAGALSVPQAAAEGPAPAIQPFFGRGVSPDSPLRVLVVGDSLAGPLATELTRFAHRDGMLTVSRDFRVGSGLAYPAYFDWPARLSYLMADQAPEVVVVCLGTNDILNMRRNGRVLHVGTPGWRDEYLGRVGEVMDIIGQSGAVAYWVGAPSMAAPFRHATMMQVNEATQQAAADRPWVHYVDIWSIFTDDDGAYTAALANRDGIWMQVRSNDGVHLTWNGTVWMATAVYEHMQADWEGRPLIQVGASAPEPTPTPTPTPQPPPEKKEKKKK